MTSFHLFSLTFQSVPESFSEFEPFEVDQVAEDDFKERDSDVDSDAFDDDDDDDNIFMVDEGTVQQDEVEDMPDYESQASDSECEGDVDFVKEMKIPFFLQLTCSLKDTRSHGQPMTPVSINTLPVCLGKNKTSLCATYFDENLLLKDSGS